MKVVQIMGYLFAEIFQRFMFLEIINNLYSARAMQRPATLFGETNAQRCARLGLEISNFANPSADATDGAAAGSGEEWTHPRSKEERSSAEDDADSRSDDASPTPTRKYRWFACTTPPYFARLCIDVCCAVAVINHRASRTTAMVSADDNSEPSEERCWPAPRSVHDEVCCYVLDTAIYTVT